MKGAHAAPPHPEAGDPGHEPRERSLWADLFSLGFVFPIAILLGLFGGRWIGGWFGHKAAGQWIGLAWGIAAAFWELFKVSRKMDRFDAEATKEAQAAEAARAKAPLPMDDDGGPGDGRP